MNGTMVNYYFHCPRQCYLFSNRLNLEDNSEIVKIGRAIHEDKAKHKDNTELKVDNIVLDKITKDYITEIKKSDADIEACKWQLYYYLKVLKDKGVYRKGRLIFIEKNKVDKQTMIIELTPEKEKELNNYILKIEKLVNSNKIPPTLNKASCKKCAYYEYCYI